MTHGEPAGPAGVARAGGIRGRSPRHGRGPVARRATGHRGVRVMKSRTGGVKGSGRRTTVAGVAAAVGATGVFCMVIRFC